MPKKNIGNAGRLLRLAIAVLLFIYAYFAKSWVAFGFGIFTLFEALASWCILYQILGKNSCPRK
jgi:branched-subunit amino acid transport protein AzlD